MKLIIAVLTSLIFLYVFYPPVYAAQQCGKPQYELEIDIFECKYNSWENICFKECKYGHCPGEDHFENCAYTPPSTCKTSSKVCSSSSTCALHPQEENYPNCTIGGNNSFCVRWYEKIDCDDGVISRCWDGTYTSPYCTCNTAKADCWKTIPDTPTPINPNPTNTNTPTPTTPACNCSWVNDVCGWNNECNSNQMRQTYVCNPVGCDSAPAQCVSDPTCRPPSCVSFTLDPATPYMVADPDSFVNATLVGNPLDSSILDYQSAFYNLDNPYPTATPTGPVVPQSIMYNGYTYVVWEADTNPTTHTFRFDYDDAGSGFNRPDENWGNQYPIRVQANGYLRLADLGFSMADPNCVISFSIVTPTPTSTPTPTPTSAVKTRAWQVTEGTACSAVTGGTAFGGVSHGFSLAPTPTPVPQTQSGSSQVSFSPVAPGLYTYAPVLPTAEAGQWIPNPCLWVNATPQAANFSQTVAMGDSATWEVGYSKPDAWVRVQGGGVYAGGNVYSYVPVNPTPGPRSFMMVQDSYPGVVAYGTNYDFDALGGAGSGFISSTNWLVKQTFPAPAADYYTTFLHNAGTTTAYTGAGAAPANTGMYLASGDLATTANWSVTGGKKITMFIAGSLTINHTLTADDTSFLAIVVQGNITVSGTLGTATYSSTNPTINGVFIANGTFDTGSSTTLKFIGKGTFIANAFTLGRKLPLADNQNYPAELFIYNPANVFNAPQELTSFSYLWQEVAP